MQFVKLIITNQKFSLISKISTQQHENSFNTTIVFLWHHLMTMASDTRSII